MSASSVLVPVGAAADLPRSQANDAAGRGCVCPEAVALLPVGASGRCHEAWKAEALMSRVQAVFRLVRGAEHACARAEASPHTSPSD